MAIVLSELIADSARRTPEAPALVHRDTTWSYAQLAAAVGRAARRFAALGIARRERIAVYLDKRPATVQALFGAAHAGAVFVPINPLLKAEQVAYILRDGNVRILVTSGERLRTLAPVLPRCPDLRAVLSVDEIPDLTLPGIPVLAWEDADGDLAADDLTFGQGCGPIDADMAAILYTSGSTGQPKGVVLSHRNLVAGAHSVAQYLENEPSDRLLCVLPLSFDYGLSQLNTAFLVGAQAVLIDYLLPRDVVRAVAQYGITGLAAVPPLWIQLASLDWPAVTTLRYLTNSGGVLPAPTLAALRHKIPGARFFLMYGLTEAFRSTYLPPEEIDRRPGSIGKAIPNAEILVVRPDGTPCDPEEPGELVHRGALVALGYWNDPVRTAERFRPAPGQPAGLPLPEIAVWSGDTVRRDADGYLYFVARHDEMIKTSGYRVSPGEIEDVVYASGLVAEAVAFGVPHPTLGQAIVLCAVRLSQPEAPDAAALLAHLKTQLPAFMVPAHLDWRETPLPRNANGKIDRALLRAAFRDHFTAATPMP